MASRWIRYAIGWPLRSLAGMPRLSFPIRHVPSHRIYRPYMTDRPSMRQFVLLSVLLHVWVVTLFGDAAGGAGSGAVLRGSAFFASLRLLPPTASAPAKKTTEALGRKNTTTFPEDAATVAPVVAVVQQPEPVLAAEAQTPIAPLALLAVEVHKPVGDFVVPPINLAPLSAPESAAQPAVVLMPRLQATPVAATDERGFAIYVAPLDGRTTVESNTKPFATPALPRLTEIPPIRELQTFVAPPPVVPVAVPAPPEPMPAVADIVRAVSPVAMPIAPPKPADQKPLARVDSQPVVVPAAASEMVSGEPAAPVPTRTDTGGVEAKPPSRQPPPTTRSSQAGQDALAPAGASAGIPSPAMSLLPVVPPMLALDLDSLRQRARQLAVEGAGARTVLPFPTVAQESPKRPMEKIFDKALKRPDCKEEYTALGLAAIVPLLRDAVKGDGCKW